MRPHTSRRRSIGVFTESIPYSVTPRRMNGNTVVGNSAPPTLPLAATAPKGARRASTWASVAPPTASTAPDHAGAWSGLLKSVSSSRGMTSLAPSPRRKGSASALPLPAATVNPRPASIATAMLPTPPVAPVTSTVPASAAILWSSSASTDSAAV